MSTDALRRAQIPSLKASPFSVRCRQASSQRIEWASLFLDTIGDGRGADDRMSVPRDWWLCRIPSPNVSPFAVQCRRASTQSIRRATLFLYMIDDGRTADDCMSTPRDRLLSKVPSPTASPFVRCCRASSPRIGWATIYLDPVALSPDHAAEGRDQLRQVAPHL